MSNEDKALDELNVAVVSIQHNEMSRSRDILNIMDEDVEVSTSINQDKEVNAQTMDPPLHERLREYMDDMEEVSAGVDTEKRVQKRNRNLDEEELWTTVGKKGKRFARALDNDELTRIPEEYVEVYLTRADKLPKQFMLAKSLKEAEIQNVVLIKYINAFKVSIRFSNDESAEKLLCAKSFNDNGFKCQKTLDVSQSYGVIKGIDLGLSEEEILRSLESDILIIEVKRLKRKNSLDGRWEQSESVRVCFKGTSLPLYISIFDIKIAVSPYVHPVTQCSNCWRYGHTLRLCSSIKPVCPKCGENHSNCETTRFRCNNCGGHHMALAKICPVFKKEKQIRELMAEHNCSYKQAITLYKPVPPTPSPPFSAPSSPECTASGPWRIMTDDQPKTVELDNAHSLADTYAKVATKKGVKQSGPGKKVRNNPRKINNDEFMNNARESEMPARMQSSNEDRETQEGRNNEVRTYWKVLLEKLREKILEKELSWEEKIKSCINIIFEQVISYIVQYFSGWPCLNFLSKYG